MRFSIIIIITVLLALVIWSCNGSQKTTKETTGSNSGNSDSGCVMLERLDMDKFNELSSDNYSLESVKQKDGKLIAEVTTNADILDYRLCWNGMVMESYPPKTNVKIVVRTKNDQGSNSQTRNLCFDLETMKKGNGDKMNLYFLDDELNLLFFFGAVD